ncbi:cyclic dehypoxanthinyl futalosine synthase [Tautonia marina]|uniref:cyclic dehypoxanthinyl futalosine synthase n=1 Tax=Tautonia marina TaxID=2653855 RepID=UPI001260A0A7
MWILPSPTPNVSRILQRAVDGERLSFEDGVTLLKEGDLLSLGRAADAVCKRLHPEPYRTYNIDRNINYSNVCAAICHFCAFYRKVGDTDAYVLDREVLLDKIRETVELGGDQILMQGGLHPELPFDWYIDLLHDIKAAYPQVNVHGFSPPEIHFLAKKFKMPVIEVLRRFKEAGLGSLPGGGGEILVDRVRKILTKGKVLSDDWLAVHRAWHELGGISTATMMFGHVETLEERIEHLERCRQLQDETGGLTAFISWTFQPDNTEMADVPAQGAFEYLRVQAVTRLYLDSIPNIQSSWVTQGPAIGGLALYFGANDMGSLMIEENVVSQAGTVFQLSVDEIKRAIREAGYIPRQRNVYYEYIDADPKTELAGSPLTVV